MIDPLSDPSRKRLELVLQYAAWTALPAMQIANDVDPCQVIEDLLRGTNWISPVDRETGRPDSYDSLGLRCARCSRLVLLLVVHQYEPKML